MFAKSTYKKLAIKWFNDALFFVLSFVAAHDLVLRNHQLLITVNGYL